MTLLQIDIQGTDATGGVVAATIEVEVTPAPAADRQAIARQAGWMSVPPGATASHGGATAGPVATAATFGAPQVQAGQAAPPQARLMAAGPEVQAQEVQIPGLSNGTGHKGAVSDFVPPKVTQAQRSMTLGRFTGGYR